MSTIVKNVVVVSKGSLAIAVNPEGVVAKVSGSSLFSANMKVINELLEAVPTDLSVGEFVSIHVPDVVSGVVTGSALSYIRTGKTINGTALSQEDVAEFKKFYELYGARVMNVRFNQARFISKENVELRNLVAKAWTELEAELKTGHVVGSTIVDTDKEIREALDAQIIEAIQAGNIVLMKELKEVRDSLAKPQVVGGYIPKLNKTPEFTEQREVPFEDIATGNAKEALSPEVEEAVKNMAW